MDSYSSMYLLEFIPRTKSNIQSFPVIAHEINSLTLSIQGAFTTNLTIPIHYFNPKDSNSDNSIYWKGRPKYEYRPAMNDIVVIYSAEYTNSQDREVVAVCTISHHAAPDFKTQMYTLQLREILTEGEEKGVYLKGFTGTGNEIDILKKMFQQQSTNDTATGYNTYVYNVIPGNDYKQIKNLQSIQVDNNISTIKELRHFILKQNTIRMFTKYSKLYFPNERIVDNTPSIIVDIILQKNLKKDGVNARPIYQLNQNNCVEITPYADFQIIQGRSVQNTRIITDTQPRIPIARQYKFAISAGKGADKKNYVIFSDVHINMKGQWSNFTAENAPNIDKKFTKDEWNDLKQSFADNNQVKIKQYIVKIRQYLNEIANKEVELDVMRDVTYKVKIPNGMLINQNLFNKLILEKNNKKNITKNNPSTIENIWRVGMSIELITENILNYDNQPIFKPIIGNMVIVEIIIMYSASNGVYTELILAPDLSFNEKVSFSANIIATPAEQKILRSIDNFPLIYGNSGEEKNKALNDFNDTAGKTVQVLIDRIKNNVGANVNYNTPTQQNNFYEMQKKLLRGI